MANRFNIEKEQKPFSKWESNQTLNLIMEMIWNVEKVNKTQCAVPVNTMCAAYAWYDTPSSPSLLLHQAVVQYLLSFNAN